MKPKPAWLLYAVALCLFTECNKALETTDLARIEALTAKERYDRATVRMELQEKIYKQFIQTITDEAFLNTIKWQATNSAPLNSSQH